MMLSMGSHSEGPTFGVSLTLLCERSGVEVPFILGDILRWLAAHALAQPDVFAEAPRSAATSHFKNAIETGTSLAELAYGTSPAVVGSLLKRWLEELPDPLLNWDQQVELLSACKDEGCIEARIASLNDAVALIDSISLGTLKPLLLFLQQYCFRQRRFDQQLLQVAVAFAPIFFPAALAAGPAELRLAEETVATLVSNALHVFNPTLAANVPVVTPQALCEAAAEIMESPVQKHHQQQQTLQQGLWELHVQYNAEHADVPASSPHLQHVPGLSVSLQQAAIAEQQLEDGEREEGSYEVYLTDGPFLASLHEMVESCVVTALFASDDEQDAIGWGADDDCGSMASSCSNVLLSGGGGASSGGASSCSIATLPLSFQGDQGHSLHCASQVYHHHQTTHHHYRANILHAASFRRTAQEGADKADAPYSPRAMLVAPLGNEAIQPTAPEVNGAPTKATGVVSTTGKAPPLVVSPAVFAELAQREVSEGSVFCIISAQPGAFAHGAATAAAAASGGGSGHCTSTTGKGDTDLLPAATLQQRQLSASACIADRQAAVLDAQQHVDQPSASWSASARRSTEGGAGTEACTVPHGHLGHGGQGQGQNCASRIPIRPPGFLHPSESRQRRMTIGGGDGHPASVTPQHMRSQQQQPQVHGSSTTGSAVAALYQHLPQLRSRSTAGVSNGSGNGSCSGGGGASPQTSDRLPRTAATSPATQDVGCIAELGSAGHLCVTLSSALTLVVRELSTPEAMAHRVPIRSMSSTAMQSEKEHLKRQLKEVAANYEALAGRPLAQALKEPLRPVYVRYHKIKALLSSGRSSPSQGAAGAAPGHTQQQLPSSRPSVVA